MASDQKEREQEQVQQKSKTSSSSSSSPPNNDNDFVIREGFPALRLPGGNKQPWIDGDEPIPIHPFWADNGLFVFHEREKLMKDCEVVFSARAKEDDQPYSAGVTYFCPSQMKPRCVLEDIVMRIFRMHTQGLEDGVMIPEQSGAEWWTLVLDEEDRSKATKTEEGKQNDDDKEDEGDEVGLHFDADYGLEDQAPNWRVHPRLATVTYLTDSGAPTVVFGKRSPPPDDPEKKTLGGDIRKGWLSHPKIGKHIAFDGRLLHGAPATFLPPAASYTNCSTSTKSTEAVEPPTKRARQEEEDRRRITLLVNVWVNHCPLDAELLEDDVCSQLQPAALEPTANGGLKGEPATSSFTMKDDVDFKKKQELKKVRLELSSSKSDPDPAGEEEFVLCSRLVTAKYGAPMRDFHGAAASGDLVELDLAEGVLSLEVGGVVEDEEDDDGDDEEEGKAKATTM